jgi:hypothetical protein
MDDRQSRKLRQLQAEMIALANDREKATSADACRAIDAKLRALAEKGVAISASIKTAAASGQDTHTGSDEARPDESRGEALRRVQKADGADGRLGRPGAPVLFGRVRVVPRPRLCVRRRRLDGVEVEHNTSTPSTRPRTMKARRRPAPRLEPDGRERGRGAAAAAEADRLVPAYRFDGVGARNLISTQASSRRT